MRTIRTKLYTFNELSEAAKGVAIEKNFDINVSYYDWWECIYDDAKENCKLIITEFDIDRASYVIAKFKEDATYTMHSIVLNCGEKTDLYLTAKKFEADYNFLVEKYSDGINKDKVIYENESDFDDEVNELEDEFLENLCNDYLELLRNEFEYLTSSEAIAESLISNEYEFTQDGNRF